DWKMGSVMAGVQDSGSPSVLYQACGKNTAAEPRNGCAEATPRRATVAFRRGRSEKFSGPPKLAPTDLAGPRKNCKHRHANCGAKFCLGSAVSARKMLGREKPVSRLDLALPPAKIEALGSTLPQFNPVRLSPYDFKPR